MQETARTQGQPGSALGLGGRLQLKTGASCARRPPEGRAYGAKGGKKVLNSGGQTSKDSAIVAWLIPIVLRAARVDAQHG